MSTGDSADRGDSEEPVGGGHSATIRTLPLKIAGVVGMLTFAFYLAVAVGPEAGIGPAIPWLVLMATASILAWFADQFQGRRAAVAAAAIFFVLGIVSPIFFAIVFLGAVVLCVIGFVNYPRG